MQDFLAIKLIVDIFCCFIYVPAVETRLTVENDTFDNGLNINPIFLSCMERKPQPELILHFGSSQI